LNLVYDQLETLIKAVYNKWKTPKLPTCSFQSLWRTARNKKKTYKQENIEMYSESKDGPKQIK
jgi:hypothetical protein